MEALTGYHAARAGADLIHLLGLLDCCRETESELEAGLSPGGRGHRCMGGASLLPLSLDTLSGSIAWALRVELWGTLTSILLALCLH